MEGKEEREKRNGVEEEQEMKRIVGEKRGESAR